jgi:hypothetical protein
MGVFASENATERLVRDTQQQGTCSRVAEGVWLSAATMHELLLNHLQGGKAMTETLWKCDQIRAGQLYNRMMFDTQAEAQQFARKMRQAEPDQTFAIEAIQASQVWN